MISRTVFGLLAVLLPQAARALDPAAAISQYHKRYWQVEEGLPQSYVTAIRPSPDGYLLVGTAEGLVRFDGLQFRPLQVDASLKLANRWISALLTARDGSLWVGTFDGELIELRAGKLRSKHKTGGSIFDLMEDSRGVIWASTRDGLLHYRNGGFLRQPGLPPPSETSWNVLATDSTGGLWVVTSAGLYQDTGEGTLRLRLPNTARQGSLLTVHAARSGGLWLGTSRGLFRGDGKGAPVAVAGVPGPVVSVIEDRDGVVWAASWGHGLYRAAHGKVTHWSTAEGLPDDSIRTLTEDGGGNLWLGMRSGGLGRWRDTRIVAYGMNEGLAGDYATIVAPDPAGNLWMGTWRGGVYRLAGDKLVSQPVPLPTLYFTARALAFDPKGNPWFGNWEGLFEFDGRRYKHHGAGPETPWGRVSALLFDRGGGLWVGTAGRGLYRFTQGRPETPPPPALFPEAEITALLEGSDGTVWAGTSNGLRRIPPPGVTPRQLAQFPSGAVHSLIEDSRGRIWAASTGSLLVIDAAGQHLLDSRHGLPDHSLYRVLEDQAGTFWVSSPRGIYELESASVERVLREASARLSIASYGQEDGLRTIECHGLSQPAGARASDGSIWFPTARGFVRIRPKTQRTAPPRVLIEELTTNLGRRELAPNVNLGAGTRNIELQFTALRFSTPGKIRFRYRMTGLDSDWMAASTLRTARYSQLPPGPHVFEVQAQDPLGDWSGAASLVLYQEPEFRQTWWFVLLLGMAAAAAVWAMYRWRLHAVRGRYAAVIEERNRIGREWHDTLVAGFSAISLQLEAALANLAARPDRASEILEMTRRMVHHYRAEARRVIWDLRDNRPEGETLPMAIENALDRVVEHRGIQTHVKVEGEPAMLPIELQHNMLRICQEAISNSVRHANPARIDVELVYRADQLMAVVRDDGRGFGPEDDFGGTAGHFGLAVMRERARRHGGALRIDSRPGAGTTVEATIPLPGAKG